MVRKYLRVLETHEINPETGKIWVLFDVPVTWRARTKAAVDADHFTWDRDGHAVPLSPND